MEQKIISITENIKDHILNNGPISFRRFIEKALYEPGIGYYTSKGVKVGTKGDFLTGPTISSLFGAMIGKQIEEMWIKSGGNNFTIVEYGAGTGKLCLDILNYLSYNSEMIKNLQYCIIERNSNDFQYVKNHFPGIISVHRNIHSLPEFSGCVISNEVVDSFPFHRVVMQDELMEVFVGYKDGFTEFLMPASEELRNYLQKCNVTLPKGYHTEINLDAKKWISEIATKLESGYMITIDYGYSSDALYNQQRKSGTMMCYKNHDLNKVPCQYIGKQDITAHVNFSALCQWGIEGGFQCCGLVTQAAFLLSLGIKEHFIRQFSAYHNIAHAALMETRLNDLLLIEMGSRFKVLIQKKGAVPSQLTGLKN